MNKKRPELAFIITAIFLFIGLCLIWELAEFFIYVMVAKGQVVYQSAFVVKLVLAVLLFLLVHTLLNRDFVNGFLQKLLIQHPIRLFIFSLCILFGLIIAAWRIPLEINHALSLINQADYNIEQYNSTAFNTLMSWLIPALLLILLYYRLLKTPNRFARFNLSWFLNEAHPLLFICFGFVWGLISEMAGTLQFNHRWINLILFGLVYGVGATLVLKNLKQMVLIKYALFCFPILIIVIFKKFFYPIVKEEKWDVAFLYVLGGAVLISWVLGRRLSRV